MSITTYDELKTAVAVFLGRDPTDSSDVVVANVPTMITLAEAQIERKLRVSELMRRATAGINEETELLPTQLAAVISVAYMSTGSAWKRLQFVTPEQLRDNYSTAGDPIVYSIVGHEILFGPFVKPDVLLAAAATMELIYWAKADRLSVSQTTNEVLEAYPDIYLYATLVQSSRFITSDQLPAWKAAYDEAIFDANNMTEENNSQGISSTPSDWTV